MSGYNIDVRQGWFKAGITLGVDPKAIVLCPSCGQRNLSVLSLPSEDYCLERIIHCEACGKREYLVMRAPEGAEKHGNS